MILAPKDESLYTRVLCIESKIFTDQVWGDYSIINGEWYDALIEDGSFNNLVNKNSILVRFREGLCTLERKFFKTELEIHDEKLKNILEQNDDEYCYYSDLPSPMSYMKR
jgi:hypothetical protein